MGMVKPASFSCTPSRFTHSSKEKGMVAFVLAREAGKGRKAISFFKKGQGDNWPMTATRIPYTASMRTSTRPWASNARINVSRESGPTRKMREAMDKKAISGTSCTMVLITRKQRVSMDLTKSVTGRAFSPMLFSVRPKSSARKITCSMFPETTGSAKCCGTMPFTISSKDMPASSACCAVPNCGKSPLNMLMPRNRAIPATQREVRTYSPIMSLPNLPISEASERFMIPAMMEKSTTGASIMFMAFRNMARITPTA